MSFDLGLFQLLGVARYLDGKLAEEKIYIKFKIVDQNDNAPVFGVISPGKVDELSPEGLCVCRPSDVIMTLLSHRKVRHFTHWLLLLNY